MFGGTKTIVLSFQPSALERALHESDPGRM